MLARCTVLMIHAWRPPDRRLSEPRKIRVQSGAERHPKAASVASALDGDLARLKTGAPGGSPFWRVARSADVRQPAVRRRCKGRAASPDAVRFPLRRPCRRHLACPGALPPRKLTRRTARAQAPG
jgi:hypothetical protein